MEREPNIQKARRWLYALGGLGAVIVIFSVVVNHIDSGISIVGYVVGFVCLLLAAMAAFAKQDGKPDRGNGSDKRRR
ncbi:hypothetical protein C7445_101337 [Alicyclobacillus sacchari]|uniref:Uncharacterized protein n=1 Tax=Alicyclobacillus sacchari TaxID=392010 RepID=A0A4R8LWZ0_9BACL|nr:hypothetical protein [Alicyclobacillus sacchari]TDY51335.1 hypothetical protein C7445_101337 [Alicyclobacillus sacchari]GMA56641.1 hypothetical protein GCM10025858_11440 [Alicyclobacillus sacchari]